MRLFARAGRPPFLISLDLSSWTQAEPPPPSPSSPPSGSSSQSPASPHLSPSSSSAVPLLEPTSPLPSRTSLAAPAFSAPPSSPILSAFPAYPSSPFISAFSASFIPPSSSVVPALPASSIPPHSTSSVSSGRLSSLPLSLSLEPPPQVSPSSSASSTRPLSHSPSSPPSPTPEDHAFPPTPMPTPEDLASPLVSTPLPQDPESPPTPTPVAPASPPTPPPSPPPVPSAKDALAVLRFPSAGGSSVAYVLRGESRSSSLRTVVTDLLLSLSAYLIDRQDLCLGEKGSSDQAVFCGVSASYLHETFELLPLNFGRTFILQSFNGYFSYNHPEPEIIKICTQGARDRSAVGENNIWLRDISTGELDLSNKETKHVIISVAALGVQHSAHRRELLQELRFSSSGGGNSGGSSYSSTADKARP
ncbi:proline-rich receptor-like protein kinase PERK10 [Penaeus chinensis]|uniref:proline-rich receptor-like protein kinase PERK10 n=1 Tax=Penaeus chinensis TaxID=139456 RepID=UPI001FB5CBFE|nr:proline-rich receptor-like protein kinase PERK10 [Penaeus chinensis]